MWLERKFNPGTHFKKGEPELPLIQNCFYGGETDVVAKIKTTCVQGGVGVLANEQREGTHAWTVRQQGGWLGMGILLNCPRRRFLLKLAETLVSKIGEEGLDQAWL